MGGLKVTWEISTFEETMGSLFCKTKNKDNQLNKSEDLFDLITNEQNEKTKESDIHIKRRPVYSPKEFVEILSGIPFLKLIEVSTDIIDEISQLASMHIRITSEKYKETDDLSAKVKQEFGDEWDVLDWNELKSMKYEELYELLEFLDFEVGKGCLTTYNGKVGSKRRFFFERHNKTNKEGKYPSNWWIPDHIANHMLDLGTWYDLNMPIIATRTDSEFVKE